MNLYERTHPTFTCADCNDRVIDRYEYRHHQDHHAGKCRCGMADHRMVPAWLRNTPAKDLTNA